VKFLHALEFGQLSRLANAHPKLRRGPPKFYQYI